MWGRPAAAFWAVMVWVPLALWADTRADSLGQLLLGALTTVLLLLLLRRESPLVRAQTLVVVVFATVIEYVFSGWLGVYEYRLGHVPAYVPVGHGLVYLAALDFSRIALVQRQRTWLVRASVLLAAGVGVAGAFGLFGRSDVLGAFWAVCLVGFLLWGPNPGLYVGALVVVTYLEVIGTQLRVWTWQPVDTIAGLVPMGNPPSVAAGGYGWFDLVATLVAPTLVGWYTQFYRQFYRVRMSTTSACSNPLVVSAQPASKASEPS